MGSSAIITARIAAFIRSLPFTENLGPKNLNSSINEQIDFFREQIRNFADDIAAKKIDQRVALRRTENEPGRSARFGEIDNRPGGRWSDGGGELRSRVTRCFLRRSQSRAGRAAILTVSVSTHP